jgi:hypothetical protein
MEAQFSSKSVRPEHSWERDQLGEPWLYIFSIYSYPPSSYVFKCLTDSVAQYPLSTQYSVSTRERVFSGISRLPAHSGGSQWVGGSLRIRSKYAKSGIIPYHHQKSHVHATVTEKRDRISHPFSHMWIVNVESSLERSSIIVRLGT